MLKLIRSVRAIKYSVKQKLKKSSKSFSKNYSFWHAIPYFYTNLYKFFYFYFI